MRWSCTSRRQRQGPRARRSGPGVHWRCLAAAYSAGRPVPRGTGRSHTPRASSCLPAALRSPSTATGSLPAVFDERCAALESAPEGGPPGIRGARPGVAGLALRGERTGWHHDARLRPCAAVEPVRASPVSWPRGRWWRVRVRSARGRRAAPGHGPDADGRRRGGSALVVSTGFDGGLHAQALTGGAFGAPANVAPGYQPGDGYFALPGHSAERRSRVGAGRLPGGQLADRPVEAADLQRRRWPRAAGEPLRRSTAGCPARHRSRSI